MSASLAPDILAEKAGSAVVEGQVVKRGADDAHAVPSSAATDTHTGIAQNAAPLAEDIVEVLKGGGGKGLAGGTITKGDRLTSDAAGKLIATVTPLNKTIAVAEESAVLNDLFAVKFESGIV